MDKKDMMLKSNSGYCMPFEEREKDVELILNYGNVRDPESGEKFFNHGIDFSTNRYLLSAVATGTVAGLGTDAVLGNYQIIRYGKYEVTYAKLSNILANYGQQVKAGQIVAVSGTSLHLEVKYNGEEINPIEFLTMLYGNVKTMENYGVVGIPEFVTLDMDIHTQYDKHQTEIEELMMRFLPIYMEDLQKGIYAVPEHTEQSLRNIFGLSAVKNYFYETIPSMSNPLGIGRRSAPIIEKVQNLLIGDFLNYMALRHHVFLSSMSAIEKKKLKNRPSSPVE